MQWTALLRGVTPTGKNRIPKMSHLAEIIEAVGFSDVKTYIQSGNMVLTSKLAEREIAQLIHATIAKEIGAELSVILKKKAELKQAIAENPFPKEYDASRIHLVFTNDVIDQDKLKAVSQWPFEGEELRVGSACLYLYLPREAAKKRLNTNFLEKKLNITATMRKLRVIQHLSDLMEA